MIVTVSSKGQIVIPAPIRKKLNIQKGAKLIVSVEDNKIVLESVEDLIRQGRGLLPTKGRVLKLLLEERKKEAGS